MDVLAALEQIMRQHTAFYQNDFDIDKSSIHRDAASDQAVDKALLWMSRPSGTYCFRERDVFLKGTRQHNTWKFYGEQTRDKILAYAVELTGTQGGTIRGNLYELDYQQHFRHVVEASQPVSVNRLFAMLPYKSLCFTSIKDRHGVYAMINKDERRDVSIRKPRPSIRKQLADSKQATSPKKAAARTKKNELEV